MLGGHSFGVSAYGASFVRLQLTFADGKQTSYLTEAMTTLILQVGAKREIVLVMAL